MKTKIFLIAAFACLAIVGCRTSHEYTAQEIRDKVASHFTFPITDNKLVTALKINNINSVRISKTDNKIFLNFSAEIRALTTTMTCSEFIYSCEPTLENSDAYLRNFKLETTNCSTPLPKEIETIVAEILFKSFSDMKFRTLDDIPETVRRFYISDENVLVLE